MKQQLLSALSMCMLVALGACSAAGDTETHSSGGTATPVFTGPHAVQMKADYESSESEFFKQVIFDGKVTEAEYREARDREAKCLIEHGFTGVEFHADGTSEYDDRTDISDEEEHQLAADCATSTGSDYVSIWYDLLAANPDNVDWPSAERDCLVKAGLLEPGTTVEQMNQWYEKRGKGSDSRQAYVCAEDALGKLGLK